MKRFAVSVLTVATFFVGLGSLVERVGARFKSDDKALDIVRKARAAIGGDAALAEIRSLVITGRSVHTLKVGDAERQEPGETEIALQFPDKLSQRIKIGTGDGTKMASEHHDVMIVKKADGVKAQLPDGGAGEFITSDGKRIVIREKIDGGATVITDGENKVIVREIEKTGPEAGAIAWKMKEPGTPGEKHTVFARSAHGGFKQNELLRLSLSLLLTAPDGIEVNYTFAGETDMDGIAVNIVNAEFGGSNYKLFIGKSNNLPVAVSYRGMPAAKIFTFDKQPGAAADGSGDHMVFTKKVAAEIEPVEYIVKFSDYRSTGNAQLPYKWTTTVGGATKEVFDVSSYDINPANIAERFADQKVFVRTKKVDGQ